MLRSLKQVLALCLLLPLLAAFVPSPLHAAEAPTRPFVPVQAGFQPVAPEVPVIAPGRVLVKFRQEAMERLDIPDNLNRGDVVPNATGLSSVDGLVRGLGGGMLTRTYNMPRNEAKARELGVDRWFTIEYNSIDKPQAIADRLRTIPDVEEVTFDYVAFPAAVPADPLYSMHWGHNNTGQLLSYNWSNFNHETGTPVGTPGFDTNAQAAWDAAQGYGSSSVIIAIIDSGVEAGHPDLNQVTGYDFGDNDSNPDDNSSSPGHGTACAGVAASMANSLGSAGAAPGCRIMPLKVANSAGSMYFSAIQNALYYAADNGADIISMSLGAAISSDSATDAALLYAWNAGCVILAASGNENASTISYPAINQYVIAVGAASPCGERKRSSSSTSELNPGVNPDPNGYTCDGERWWGSNYGVNTQNAAGAVDVIAPTILPTTDLLGSAGYDSSDYSKWFNGTSCATPYAAGVCALIKSANPSWTPTQIRTQLRNTAQDVVSVESGTGWDRYTGYGMVDAAAAVGGGGGSTDVVTVTYPNGGQTFTAGDAATITWSWSGTFSTVNIDYSTNGGTSWTSIVTGTANDGSYAWTIPSVATTQGRVRVSGGTASDMSDANFTIQLPGGGYASLPYSTGFETGSLDQYWSTAVTSNGRVQVTTANSPHSGSWHLTMDEISSGTYATTEAWLHLNLSGQSDVALAFWWKEFGDETHSQDGVYFSSNGGASFVKVQNLNGQSYTNNTWQSFNLDLDALAAANGLSLTGTFVVKFQQYDNYPIATDGFAFDDISVTAVAPPVDAVTVTAPNGGENLTSGTGTNITWTWTGTFSTVNIDYSTNGGSTWTSIVTGTANDGSYTWTVPAVATTQGRVRVSGGTATDMSNANFTITVPPPDAVTVTAPNGGETLTAGTATNITWTSQGTFTTVNIDYSTNGGTSWTSIVTGTANDGSYSWTVPAIATTQGRVRVSGGTATDMSNANFTIDVPQQGGYATLPYSTGFEGGTFDAYWTTTSTSNGRILLTTANGPHGGSYHMTMDEISSGTYATNEAWLHLNLTGQTDVTLSFWWKEFGDETHTQDGVYFSSNGGTSFVKVQALNGQSYTNNTWQSFTLDLDALAAANGLSLTSTFVVKFQQYDNYPIATDGMAFDDISVTAGGGGGGGGAITAETEPNGTTGTANGPVGTGVAVSGSISSSSDQDYFYLDVSSAGNITITLNIGSSADLDWFLYNSSGTEVARGYTTSNPEVGSYNASAGRYYLMVDGYLSAVSSYTVTVSGGLANSIQPASKTMKPLVTALLQNSPNPFRAGTAVNFSLAESGRVTLQVFDVNGRLITTLADREFAPGAYALDWSGQDETGRRVQAGVYFYRLITPGTTQTRKMLLID